MAQDAEEAIEERIEAEFQAELERIHQEIEDGLAYQCRILSGVLVVTN